MSESNSPAADPLEVFALPASFGQDRFWRLDQLNPGNPAWSVPVRFRLSGALNTLLVEQAFNEIVKRHEVLRASFMEEDGVLLQIVRSHLSITVPVVDLRHLASSDRDAEVDRISMQEARWRFDLSTCPLLRVRLLRIEDEQHVLLVNAHHTVVDYSSIGIIAGELAAFYTAFSRGQKPSLPELPVQYGDYSVWQREHSTTPETEEELILLKDQLADLPLLDFRTDKPRPDSPTFESTITSALLPAALTDSFRELGSKEGATFFSATLGVLSLVLYQYTGQTDFGVATQVGGRASPEIESLIGLFINTVVLRPDLSGDPTFRQFLGRMQRLTETSIFQSNIRFENLLARLRPDTYPSHHTLFRINFICQRDPVKPQEFEGVKLTVIPSKSQGALYDLHVFLIGRNEGWRLACEYNTDLYQAGTIECFLEDYRRMLESIVANPDLPISQYGLSDSANTQRQMKAAPKISNEECGSVSPESVVMPASVTQLRFWRLEQFSPGNPALHMRACVRLRGVLRIGEIERSLNALVDRHETLRTTFIEEENELHQVIVPKRPMALAISCLDDVKPEERETKLRERIHEEARIPFDLIQGPLLRARLFRLSPDEHVLMITTHHILSDGWSQTVIQSDLWKIYEAFSESVEPQLAPLAIHYADYVHWQQEWLASEAARDELAFWQKKLASPLPVLDIPVDTPTPGKIAPHGPMETMLLSRELRQALKRLGQDTETTMFMVMLTGYSAMLHRYTGQEDILMGSPVANRRPETESLIGPFSGPISLRLDMSGNPTMRDLLFRIRDTTIEAFNHKDLPFEVLLDNLDVRSVRGRNPISQCYFFYQNAFLQPRTMRDLSVTPLPDFGMGTHFELQMGLLDRQEGLRAQLEYNAALFEPASIRRLLDSYVLILESFVRNPKLHLSELPSHTADTRLATMPAKTRVISPAQPHDEVERELIHMWEELLRLKGIGPRDNYFELGGSSILAVRLVSRIEKVFGIRLPPATLIHAQTVESLAKFIRRDGEKADWAALVEIQPGGGRPKFFCVHGAGGNVLMYRDLARHLGPDQPFYGLQSQGLDGRNPPLESIEEMASLYVREVQRVQPHGPYLLGGYCMGGTVALEMAQIFMRKGEEVTLLALFDTMNWAKLAPARSLDRVYYQVQRVGFHLRNFLLLSWRGKRRFLREKTADFRSRTTVWRGAFTAKFAIGSGTETSEPELLARIWKINDDASMRYVPSPYRGTITEFRPTRQYSRYKGLETQWKEIALGGQISVTLPVYPAGMLLEPFVQDLAAALRQAIERTTNAAGPFGATDPPEREDHRPIRVFLTSGGEPVTCRVSRPAS